MVLTHLVHLAICDMRSCGNDKLEPIIIQISRFRVRWNSEIKFYPREDVDPERRLQAVNEA